MIAETNSQSKSHYESKIITVIAAYNEETRIRSVIQECSKYSDLVVVIDDGSLDATSNVARSVGALVVKHKKNKGKGMALRTSIKFLRRYSAKVIVFIDADGQDNPNFIPDLVGPILNGKADLVIGSRFLKGGGTAIPGHKVLGNKILTFLTNLFTGFAQSINESQCGFRAIRFETISNLNLLSTRFEIESEMIIEAVKSKLRILEVPIRDNLVLEAIEKGTKILDGAKIALSLFRIALQKKMGFSNYEYLTDPK